jgi:N-sulfoglucosamine sulfohydrolase
MKKSLDFRFLRTLLCIVPLSLLTAEAKQPNILFLTMDDMNWDSIGSYGSPVEDISPHIDGLADTGMRFQHAFVNSPVCTPSRNVMQTGCYPHVSGVQGFYSVKFPHKTVPESLREAGYFTGIVQKLPDSTPTNNYRKYWDYHKGFPRPTSRTPAAYAEAFAAIADGAAKNDQPFYAVINVVDPHLPFYNGPKTQNGDWDRTPPSRVYEPDEVPIPGFLPQDKAFAQEVADYYSTVRRGDDCIGLVMAELTKRDLQEDTIIIFLSDHGMSFPFAKSNLYPEGVRTPWIVVWPGVAEPGYLDTEHMISTIDFMPTVLDMAGLEIPEHLEGRSIVPLVKGEAQEGWDRVFVQFNENPNADIRPTRGIYTKDFVYIFTPWSNGERQALFESRWYRSYGTFFQLAKEDAAVNERFQFLMFRTHEELYHYTVDPFAKNNLFTNRHYAGVLEDLQSELLAWMERTNDYALPAFKVRADPEALEAWMLMEDDKALSRSEDTEWKRWRNRSGPTGQNSAYHDPSK